jgi:predicted GNAT family acetyltransferase
MNGWAEFEAAEERRGELLREAERWRLVKALRRARKARRRHEGSVYGASGEPERGGIEVRWGMAEDEPRIARLLELNGMPRWVAFEERYVVAEEDGEILAALRYRTEPKRLVLGLLVTDPWAEERSLAVALYAGAVELASEMGAKEIRARADRHSDYPREAGYRRRRGDWHLDVTRSGTIGEEAPPKGRWRRVLGFFGIVAVPFVGVLRKQG